MSPSGEDSRRRHVPSDDGPVSRLPPAIRWAPRALRRSGCAYLTPSALQRNGDDYPAEDGLPDAGVQSEDGLDEAGEGAGRFDAPQRRAVAESTAELNRRWAVWCGEHDLDDVGEPVTEPPVVYRVGIDAESSEWVALIRFHAEAGGQSWHGLVRGPLGDVTFRVAPVTHAQRSTDRRQEDISPPTLIDRIWRWRTRQR